MSEREITMGIWRALGVILISSYQTVGLCIMGVYEVPICVNENIVLISGEILG